MRRAVSASCAAGSSSGALCSRTNLQLGRGASMRIPHDLGPNRTPRCNSAALIGFPGERARCALSATPLQQPQAQRVQLDEALGVALVVDFVLLEGDMGEAVEGLRRLAADDAHAALVELEPDRALDMLLALVDEGLQHLALRAEPEAIVDELGVARHQLVLEVHGAAVERQALDAAMGCGQDRAAGRLIDAPALHAHEAVLHQVEPAYAMRAAERVEPRQEARRRERLAVDRDRVAAAEPDLDIGGPVGRLLGRDRAAVDEFLRLVPGILQRLALGGDVQEIGIDREGRLAALVPGDRDLVLFRELQQARARAEVPFTPGGDHLDVRVEGVIGELETHLVVALAGGAMGDGIRPRLPRDLDLALGDQRPGDRGAEQVTALVERIGAEHREDEVAHEFLAQVLEIDLLDAEQLGLLARGLQLLPLPQVGGEGDHLAAIGRLQPFQDHGGVEPAGIGEHDLLHVARHRKIPAPVSRKAWEYRDRQATGKSAPARCKMQEVAESRQRPQPVAAWAAGERRRWWSGKDHAESTGPARKPVLATWCGLSAGSLA